MIADVAHSAPSRAFLVVDNTFLSPYFQRPLELGADVVCYSISKYLNGHSDVIMGSVCLNDDDLAGRIRFLQNAIGPVPSPFDCYLVNRSLKTLKVRMEEHQKNAIAVAKWLEANKVGLPLQNVKNQKNISNFSSLQNVSKVLHPGLESHPHHEIAKKQQYGNSGMLSFYHKGGLAESRKFLSALKLVRKSSVKLQPATILISYSSSRSPLPSPWAATSPWLSCPT